VKLDGKAIAEARAEALAIENALWIARPVRAARL
jgi:hypothetical protein